MLSSHLFRTSDLWTHQPGSHRISPGSFFCGALQHYSMTLIGLFIGYSTVQHSTAQHSTRVYVRTVLYECRQWFWGFFFRVFCPSFWGHLYHHIVPDLTWHHTVVVYFGMDACFLFRTYVLVDYYIIYYCNSLQYECSKGESTSTSSRKEKVTRFVKMQTINNCATQSMVLNLWYSIYYYTLQYNSRSTHLELCGKFVSNSQRSPNFLLLHRAFCCCCTESCDEVSWARFSVPVGCYWY